MEAGYSCHLVNTAAVQTYSGLKYTDDNHDARWLAHLLRLNLLPTGTIYPKVDRATDNIYVGDDRDATILHVPPKAKELENRIKNICNFANTASSTAFLHPVLKAIMLHFMLAYDHPFEDGNGRTARALFYWSMLKQGYWTMEFISISRILKSAPAKYTRAYLYTETDDNDVTYFIIHQLEVIKKAINDLLLYLKKKSYESKALGKLINKSSHIQNIFNYRQIALINRALKNPEAIFLC